MRLSAAALLSTIAALVGCQSSPTDALSRAEINDQTKFAVSAYGPASPRLTKNRKVRRGGGRRHVGRPYTIAGKRFVPRLDPDYDRKGLASWYGPNFHGRLTANGEIYDQYRLSAAHPTMPLPSYARVTNLENGRSVIVRVNDRGPFTGGRIIDLSGAAAKRLKYRKKGLARVRVTYEGPAPLDGRDDVYLAGTFEDRSNAMRNSRARAAADLRNNDLGERFIIPAYAALEGTGSSSSGRTN